jgi:chromosome segregation ATPase
VASNTKGSESPLVAASRELTEQLARFESQSSELSRLTVNSDKALHRARQGLETCATHEAALARALRAFAEAMQGVQATQQRCVEVTAATAARIAARQEERVELQIRLATLGENARQVSAPVTDLVENGADESGALLGSLQEVERRLGGVIAEAGALCEAARAGDWTDLERDTQGLREQLQSLKNRVGLMRTKVAHTAPS